ncbi:MAG: 3-dehydroquinate synthase [Peptococcaceae bacterium]|nr:MAG: 3-dehydroquinate synthase [Peptococcaceae bacterium]
MKQVAVNLGSRSYHICIGAGLLAEAGAYLDTMAAGKKVLLVTGRAVHGICGAVVEESLRRHGYRVTPAVMPDGEEYKTLATAEWLYDLAFAAELDRRCPVIALGGGVAGDVAGFVAATYLRGVPLVQIPTTLLAQVDSSVGGKVAVNHPKGKNIIGAFYQPRLVLADLDALGSLPRREIRGGLAEIIKYGVIWSRDFFSWLEDNLDRLLRLDREALAVAVEESCRIKAQVVEQDETEQGLRAILNYGHTVGHAIEALTGYRRFIHGEAVAVGMVAAARLAQKKGLLAADDCSRVEALIARAGLPVKLPPGITAVDLKEFFYRDKKVVGGRLTFVLPQAIGRVNVFQNLSEEDLVFIHGES